MGIGIQKRGGLVRHHLLQDRGDRLALGKPLTPDPGEELCGICLVEHDSARRPAVRECQPVQLVENPGRGRSRKPHERQNAQMRVAQHGFKAASQRLIG